MSRVQLNTVECQIAVIGSGLPGSIMALILARLGFDVVVIDKSSHPRFAIGESSTPIADAYLARIANEYDIKELLPLSTYAKTRAAYPELEVGRKRGFSYFWHQPGEQFSFDKRHANELVVAASPNDELADSHWLRSDVDCQIASWFSKYQVQLLDNCLVHSINRKEFGWEFDLNRESQRFSLHAKYFVDASGGSAVGIRALGGKSRLSEMWTNTSAVFAHLKGLKRWSEFVPSILANDYPYRCDDAAVHHLIRNGWMWQLRFDSGLTSCGIIQVNNQQSEFLGLAGQQQELNNSEALSYFQQVVSKYPSLEFQFTEADSVTPKGKAFYRERLQHWLDRGSGEGWCALPNTIGFVDPLHSKGMAHALSGVYRLAKVFAVNETLDRKTDQNIERVAESFQEEFQFLDRLIATCYLSLESFELFRLATFWYFAAATNFEYRACDQMNFDRPFLLVDDVNFRNALYGYFDELKSLKQNRDDKLDRMRRLSETLLHPYDRVGLFEPPIPNMYWNTSAPEKTKSV